MEATRVLELLDIFEKADLKSVSNYRLNVLLMEMLSGCPLPKTIEIPTIFVERGRVNSKDGIEFNSEKDISYNEINLNINKYGRANLLMQPMFYGCSANDKIKEPRIVVTFEAFEEIRLRETVDKRNLNFITIGKWASKSDLNTVYLNFSTRNLKHTPKLKEILDSFIIRLVEQGCGSDLAQAQIKVIEFLSNCYERKVASNDEYKFTALLSSLIFNPPLEINDNEKIDCIVYQSIQTEYDGTCVAIKPKAIENKFELIVAGIFKIVREKNHIILDNYAVCDKFAPLKTNFQWDVLEGLNETQYDQVFSQMNQRKLKFKI